MRDWLVVRRKGRQARGRLARGWRITVVFAVLVLLGLVAMGLRGRGLRVFVQSKVRAVLDIIEAVRDNPSVTPQGDFGNIIFLHHSTGHNLIYQGGVRERFAEAGYEFWDHGYNDSGLTRPDGTPAGYSYGIPYDNTDPDGLAGIFAQRVHSRSWNALSGLMQHEVVIFKSCFPVSHIASQGQLDQYKHYYLQMREVLDQHPDHLFVVVTPPPLNPAATDDAAAARARSFADWLRSDSFLARHTNVFTFDFFDYLAEDDPNSPDFSMLRAQYRPAGADSHPNRIANETIGPLFAAFVVQSVEAYRVEMAGVLE